MHLHSELNQTIWTFSSANTPQRQCSALLLPGCLHRSRRDTLLHSQYVIVTSPSLRRNMVEAQQTQHKNVPPSPALWQSSGDVTMSWGQPASTCTSMKLFPNQTAPKGKAGSYIWNISGNTKKNCKKKKKNCQRINIQTRGYRDLDHRQRNSNQEWRKNWESLPKFRENYEKEDDREGKNST